MKTEADVKTAVKRLCVKYGAWYCMPATGGYGRSGIPDFLICVGGHFVAVETKFGKNKPTPAQQRELDLVNQTGGTALLIWEHNLPDLEKVLEYHTGGPRGGQG